MRKKGGAPEQLANMPIEDLLELRKRVEQLISARIDAEKNALVAKLDAIKRFERQVDSAASTNSHHGAKIAPKYRNPETGETWAGRGMQPRWMRQAIKDGSKPEDFLIDS